MLSADFASEQSLFSKSSNFQTYNNTWNTSIPPGVLSFQVKFVDKFNLMVGIFLLLFWPYQIQSLPGGEGLDLKSNIYMQDLCPE